MQNTNNHKQMVDMHFFHVSQLCQSFKTFLQGNNNQADSNTTHTVLTAINTSHTFDIPATKFQASTVCTIQRQNMLISHHTRPNEPFFSESPHVDSSHRNHVNGRESTQQSFMACNAASDLSQVGAHRMENTTSNPSFATTHTTDNRKHVGRQNNGSVLLSTSLVERGGHDRRSKHGLESKR